MATGQTNQNKISPRKFSEKIALLNKKEAEGNAEFEEIIKEVQATRCQSACTSYSSKNKKSGHQNRQTNDCEDDELEAVFKNLIKCVGQYEQELQEQSQSNTQTNEYYDRSANPHSEGLYDVNSAAPESIVHIQPSLQQATNQALSECMNLPTNDSNNNIFHSYQAAEGKVNFFNDLHSIEPNCEQDTSYCRARVTSVGSADQKLRQQVHLPPRYSSHQDAWISSNTDMYLKPACDKSWQKSCSDPALHVGNAPINNIVSCSDNLLANDCAMLVGTNKSTAVTINGQADNCISNMNHFINSSSNKYHYFDNNRSTNLKHVKNNLQETEAQQIRPQQPRQILSTSKINHDQNNVSMEQQYIDNNSGIMNDVPGISICSIEDDQDNQQLRLNIDNSGDSSLPNLSNLEFDEQTTSQSLNHFQQTNLTASIHSSESQLYNDKCQATQSQPTSTPVDSSLNQLQQQGRASQQPLFDVGPMADWSSSTLNDTSLYVPKVNNLLSTSECGLTCYGQQSDPNSYNNIIRSHSHNSIEYIAKQKMANKYSSNQHYNQPPDQLLNQYDNQFRLQIGHAGHYCNQSNSSMKPQHGSISPIDSSSNLTSPQSEQNSPGSSTTEYNEFLPYPSGSQIQNHVLDDGSSLMLQNQQQGQYVTHQAVSTRPQHYHESNDVIQPILNQNQTATTYIQTSIPPHQPPQQQQQQQRQMTPFQESMSIVNTNATQDTSYIGPCQSPSSSRRTHNLVCRGTYSSQTTTRGSSGKN